MGCANYKKIEEPIIEEIKFFDDYETADSFNYKVYYFNLLWKAQPIICIYQIIEKVSLNKKEVPNLTELFSKTEIMENNNFKTLIKKKLALFYIHCNNGIIITRNHNKVNYYMSNFIDNIIDICLVDLSKVYLSEKENFSIYEVKKQSKYFFKLDNKEINFTDRKELINKGKSEKIECYENNVEDEIEEEINNINKNRKIIIKLGEDKYKQNNNQLADQINSNNVNGVNQSINIQNSDKDQNSSIKNSNVFDNQNMISINKINISENIKLLEENSKISNKLTRNKINLKANISTGITKNKSQSSILSSYSKEINGSSQNLKKMQKSSKKNVILKIRKKTKNKQSSFLSVPNIIANNSNNNISEMTSINTSIKFIENNQQNNNKNNDQQPQENKEIIQNIPPLEIKQNTLIIHTSKITGEVNQELEELLFDKSNNYKNKFLHTYSAYDHIECTYQSLNYDKKKRTVKCITNPQSKTHMLLLSLKEKKNQPEEKNSSKPIKNYIIIHNRFKIPFEKRESKNQIQKIIFTDFTLDSQYIYYLKEMIDMLIEYKNLNQISLSINTELDNKFIGWKYLARLFRENFNIRWVSLRKNCLDDKIFDMIISSMNLKRIRYLNISGNNITNKGMYCLNTFLFKNQTLSILYMTDNKEVTSEGIKLITKALQKHPNIIKLDFSNMNLQGSGQFMSTLLCENKSLKTLNLRNVKLNKNDMKFLSEELSKIENGLTNLDLGLNNNIKDEGLKGIGKIISNNRHLKSIGLDGLDLSMNNYLPIFEGIFKNRCIESYSLNMNYKLPIKGILNFFLKNSEVKELSIIPWDQENDKDGAFTQDQLHAIEKFHMKAPNVIIKGIEFVE